MLRISSLVGALALTAMAGTAFAAAPQTCAAGTTYNTNSGTCVSSQSTADTTAQKDKPYYVIERKMPTSGTPYELHFVETNDEIYVPVGVRKPAGNGPFPIILAASGNGARGVTKIDTSMYRIEPMFDELMKRGYAVAFANYRNEVPTAYNRYKDSENVADGISGGARALKADASLDSDDYIAIIQHLQSLPWAGKVGTIGSSHAGELQAKASTKITWGAGVLIEGAMHEFLPVDYAKAEYKDRTMMIETVEKAKSIIDMKRAEERAAKMKTPLLHLGRDGDHLQGIFRLGYDLQKAAGGDATWMSANHPTHGYGLIYRKEDGSYQPDEVQAKFFDIWVGYFDKYLKGSTKAASAQ